jgi:dienelactone hydrolase
VRADRVAAAALAAAAVIGMAAGSAAARTGGFPRFGQGCARADFASIGTTVRAELCRSRSSSGRAVVVLHGCGGFSTFDSRLARELPRLGISTLDVDFFGPTPPPGKRGFCGVRGSGRDAFPVWLQVAEDAARALRATTGVDRRGVGVAGWSLGGAVAIEAAQTGRRPFDAVAAFSARGDPAGAPGMPPTILLSGGSTDAIPLAETLPFYRALRRAGIPSSLYVYPHGSHGWPGIQGTLGIRHAAAFLRRYLR